MFPCEYSEIFKNTLECSGRLLLYLPISTVTDLISKKLHDYVHLTIQIERWCPFPFLRMPLKIYFWSMIFQTQPTRGVLKKSCSENMQQIYRRTFPRNSSGWLLLIFITSPCSNYWCHQISSLFTFQTFGFKPFMGVWILHLRQGVALCHWTKNEVFH